MENVKKRFFKKVKMPKDKEKCWIWKGSVGGCRYGGFYFNGKPELSHRMSWIIHYGPIPDGLYVCHKCDNTKCVNPKHLFIGTQADNNKDARLKGRAVLNKGPNGSKHYLAKLDESKVCKIWELIKQGFTQREIAKRYDVCFQVINNIWKRKTWCHVTRVLSKN